MEKSFGHSPWGAIQHRKILCRGVRIVETAGHGGALVTKAWAQKNLSIAAQKEGEPWGNYLAYEEDCAIEILFHEFPEFHEKIGYLKPLDKESVINSLSSYYPNYLIAVGVKPNPERYARYLAEREREARRAAHDPNLITAAQNHGENAVKVWAANDAQYLVTPESYKAVQNSGSYNLSECVVLGEL